MLFFTVLLVIGAASAASPGPLYQTRRSGNLIHPFKVVKVDDKMLNPDETFSSLRYQVPWDCEYAVLEVTAYDYGVAPEISFVSNSQVTIVRRGDKVGSNVIAKYYCDYWYQSAQGQVSQYDDNGHQNQNSQRAEYY